MAKKLPERKVQVSEKALIKRINRALQKQDECLRTCREDSRWFMNLGRYYIVDASMNVVVHHDVDLEETARELGVLHGWEMLESSS